MRYAAVVNHGATTIHHLAALYERCTLWLGNDGGPRHVAAAVKTPTLAVFRRRLGAVWSDLRPGSGQYAIDAGSNNLQEIEPARVTAAATELLTRYANRRNA
jgi:ADP-heptose:LPS heptosyltransferase